jgi:glycosyltransferase involved in cell wall biosynthesis
MADSPTISILMPAYNYGHYIEQAVRSAFAQTYAPVELIVVDDGSTDDTWAKLERLKPQSPFPMHLLKGAHKGVAAALNLATRSAKGEWLAILHADDWFHPEKLARQVATLDGEAVVLSHTEYVCVDEHGKETGYSSSTDMPPATGDALRRLLLLQADVRSMTMLIRRSALERIGPYDESLPVEDWQSILRLARVGQIRHVPEQLVFRRVHGQNISIGAQKLKKFDFKEIGIEVLREVAPPDLDFDRLCVMHSSVVIRNAMAQGGWKKAIDGLEQCWERFPRHRALLLALTADGVRSFVWLHGVRDRLPPSALKALLGLKAQVTRLRAARANPE